MRDASPQKTNRRAPQTAARRSVSGTEAFGQRRPSTWAALSHAADKGTSFPNRYPHHVQVGPIRPGCRPHPIIKPLFIDAHHRHVSARVVGNLNIHGGNSHHDSRRRRVLCSKLHPTLHSGSRHPVDANQWPTPVAFAVGRVNRADLHALRSIQSLLNGGQLLAQPAQFILQVTKPHFVDSRPNLATLARPYSGFCRRLSRKRQSRRTDERDPRQQRGHHPQQTEDSDSNCLTHSSSPSLNHKHTGPTLPPWGPLFEGSGGLRTIDSRRPADRRTPYPTLA